MTRKPPTTTTSVHSQQSTKSLCSLRIGAFHYMFNVMLAFVACGCMVAGLVMDAKQWVWGGSVVLAAWVVSLSLFFVMSYSWKCPLCMGRLWVKTGCRRHTKAVQTLGISYRLGAALAIVTGKPYRCPYCGEPFSTTKARK